MEALDPKKPEGAITIKGNKLRIAARGLDLQGPRQMAHQTQKSWGQIRTANYVLLNIPNKKTSRASLVAQRLRIRLPMRGTRVRALVREDPTCRGAAGPVSHNY